MTVIEKLHYENGVNDLEYISNATETTRRVAVDFCLWQSGDCGWIYNNGEWVDNYGIKVITVEQLFDEFLKTYTHN